MKHLLSHSVYQKLEDIHPEAFGDIGCDGLELLTSHLPVDKAFKDHAVTVHLPFATDWYSVWNGASYDIPENYAKFYTYGNDRESIVETMRSMIDYAAPLDPGHGVIHASSVSLNELRSRQYSFDPHKVLTDFCEMINTVVSNYPKGEPPFRLVFENLWWPGLRMLDDSDFKLLQDKVEFENWGLCLDTGHLMNTIPDIMTEHDGIEALESIFDSYSNDMVDSISAMHFHYSASGEYRNSFPDEPRGDEDVLEYIRGSYGHISTLDQHLPFSDKACNNLIECIQPEYVIHELPGHGGDPLADYVQQRSLLGRSRQSG